MACGIGPHILALSSSGEVFNWDHNGFAQLGHDTSYKDEPTKLQIPGYVTQIQCGSYHSVALTSDGFIYSWGLNNHGQLGLGPIYVQPFISRVSGMLANKKITAIACGQLFSIAIDSNGGLYSWWGNTYGQLVIGTATKQYFPTEITTLNGIIIEKIICGRAHTLALTDSGELYTWERTHTVKWEIK